MHRRLPLLIALSVLAFSIVIPVFSEWSTIVIKDPSSDIRINGATMSTSDPSPCGSTNYQNALSNCDYDYTYGICNEEGDWTAQATTYTRNCGKDSACSQGGSFECQSCYGCTTAPNTYVCKITEQSTEDVIYNINWDTDTNDCTCHIGAGFWNLGGDYANPSCCTDDASEFKNTCTDSDASTNAACGADTLACCNADDDCVDASGNCQTEAACYTFGTGHKSYCLNEIWEDPDEASGNCVATCDATSSDDGVEWIDSTCCGDDSGEYLEHRICTSGCSSDTGDKKCCDASNDCVWGATCYNTGSYVCNDDTLIYCNAGSWESANNRGDTDGDGLSEACRNGYFAELKITSHDLPSSEYDGHASHYKYWYLYIDHNINYVRYDTEAIIEAVISPTSNGEADFNVTYCVDDNLFTGCTPASWGSTGNCASGIVKHWEDLEGASLAYYYDDAYLDCDSSNNYVMRTQEPYNDGNQIRVRAYYMQESPYGKYRICTNYTSTTGLNTTPYCIEFIDEYEDITATSLSNNYQRFTTIPISGTVTDRYDTSSPVDNYLEMRCREYTVDYYHTVTGDDGLSLAVRGPNSWKDDWASNPFWAYFYLYFGTSSTSGQSGTVTSTLTLPSSCYIRDRDGSNDYSFYHDYCSWYHGVNGADADVWCCPGGSWSTSSCTDGDRFTVVGQYGGTLTITNEITSTGGTSPDDNYDDIRVYIECDNGDAFGDASDPYTLAVSGEDYFWVRDISYGTSATLEEPFPYSYYDDNYDLTGGSNNEYACDLNFTVCGPNERLIQFLQPYATYGSTSTGKITIDDVEFSSDTLSGERNVLTTEMDVDLCSHDDRAVTVTCELNDATPDTSGDYCQYADTVPLSAIQCNISSPTCTGGTNTVYCAASDDTYSNIGSGITMSNSFSADSAEQWCNGCMGDGYWFEDRCCGDDTGEDYFDGGRPNFLCDDGQAYSCIAAEDYQDDIDYSIGGKVGIYYCTESGWSTSLPVDYDDSKTYCEGGGGTWFGGAGEEGCCESGEEFVSDIVIEDDLELYFRFSESLGSDSVNDTQNGLVGTLQGSAAIVTSTAFTVNPNAVDFDGTDSYISVNDDSSLDLDQNVTLCAWVFPESTDTNYHIVLSKGCGGSYRNYNMYVRDTDNDGDFFIHLSHQTEASPETGGFNGTYSPEVVMRDQWNFICSQAYPASGGTHRHFANGKLIDTDTSPDFTSLKTNDRDFCVGATGGYYFDGKIDEVMVWNRTLSEEEVAILYRSFPERTQNDTYLYFDLDEGSGDPLDSSQYGNDGVRSGAVWITGKSGGALEFDGSNDHVNTSSGWNPKGDFTVMAFVNTNQSMAGDTRYRDPAIIATQGIGGLTEDWTLTLYHGQLSWYDQFNSAAHDGQSSENISDGTWHHVAAVRDGSNVYLYVDSSLVDTISSAAGSIRDHTINLGVFWWDGAVFFDGFIDEVRVFDRALDTGEIEYYSDVEKWKKYGCDDSEFTICESTDDCYKTVDEGGIAYYCYGSYYSDYRLIVDNCQNICTDQGGSWQGGGGDKNCCISNTETWCNESTGIDNLCYAGVVYPCDYWCDVLGTVDSYFCTSDADGDCTSSTTCGAGTCDCFKSVGTVCTQSTECSNGNCIDYQRTTTADPSLGKMYSAAEIGLSGKVCCPSGACAFDQDKDDTIDSCATDTSYSVDPDRDDDLDYCNNGVWQECENGIAANNISSDCECLGAGIAVNKSNLGVCRVPPISFTYDTDVTCGTKCDSDSDLGNTEIIDGAGQCVIPETGCSTVLEEVSWSGNDTLIEVNVTANCPCDEDASCAINVSQGGSELSYKAFIGSDGVNTQTTLDPDFNYGDNNISISCSCSTVPVTCSRTYPATIKSSAIVTDPDCVSGKNCYISINVSNVGNVMSNTEASLDAIYGSLIYTNTSSYNLASNASYDFTFANNQSCDWQNATWLTGKANILVEYEATIDLTETTYQFGVNETGIIRQCEVAADCTTCCAGYWWCWHNSSSAGDFVCSEGVCCPSGEHFQSGACCISSERCCIDDTNCNDGEWCDNYTTGFPAGELFCRDEEPIGSSCLDDRECISEYCGNGICADPNPVQLSEWYECNPYQGNAFCSYESVSGTYSFDPRGCNQDDDCSSKYYCYAPRRACLECANSSTTYGSLNISDDGLCPSTSCIGYDLDCCSSDSDCASGEWCDAAGSCKGCSTRSDGVCASSSCVSSDPDCCTTDGDCGQGLSCVSNACTGNIGESCSSDGDCTGGLKCLGTPGVCAKESFISLSPEETTYTASLGSVMKLTLIVADPQNKQDSYKVEVDPSYIPDSAFVEIDGVKSEEFEMGAGEVRKFLVSVAAAKITDSSPDIESVIRVESLTTPSVDDQVTIRVDVDLVDIEGVPSAPLNAWIGVLILGYIIGLVTRG